MLVLHKKVLKNILLLIAFCLGCQFVNAQYRLRLYNNYDQDKLYNNDTISHTAWRPVIYTDTVLPQPDTSMSWFKRKLLYEHLLQVQGQGFNIYGDIILDEYIGKSDRKVTSPGMNTRGYEVSGNIGNKFYFETNFYENQGKFGGYVDSFITKNLVIPGQANYKGTISNASRDFSISTARLVYMPNKHWLFDLGYGKNFIGDGYRSLLLSDWSINYPYLRASYTHKKFQYSVMWSQYLSGIDRANFNKKGFYRKWAQTYVIDWNVVPGLNLSLFESVIWPDQTRTNDREKDISPSLLSPVIFLHGSKSPSGVSNNDIVGLNAKFKVYSRTFVYGQMVVNQLGSSFKNRTGFQLGLRSGDVFEIDGLNVDVEFNTVRPYTYAGSSPDVSYSNANQPLAHPLGANFTEGIFVATYNYKRLWLRAEGFIAKYGLDSGNVNYGQNIFTLLPSQSPVGDDVKTGQGLSTKITYADFKAAYIINPQSNLRIESGITYRKESNSLRTFNDFIFYVGLRMSFRSLLYDF